MTKEEQQELDRWKSIAAWLADCHAANLHEAELSSCSQDRRDRFKSIMLKAADFLKRNTAANDMRYTQVTPDERLANVILRLEDHAAKIPTKPPKKK